MATYAIGDIQGCYQSFQKLLKKIEFDPRSDQLWLAGDMINRGPQSLATMAFIMDNQKQIRCVLGNHDLHFLAVAHDCQSIGRKDTFTDILNSELRESIVQWLSEQPLVHFDSHLNMLMVHAGLPFDWTIEEILSYAKEVSNILRSAQNTDFYSAMYGDMPNRWDSKLKGLERLRFITNALTRMRFCLNDGSLELKAKSTPCPDPKPDETPLIPWFNLLKNKHSFEVVFGHWASLKGNCPIKNIYALDTGCVWGGQLTALRIEDKKYFQVKAVEDS